MHSSFDLFISHNTKDDSHDVFQAVSNFISAYDKKIFNPTTHLSHEEQINKAAMQGAVRRSKLVVAALSEGFFASKWCEAEIEAARDAGIKVIPCFSGDDHAAKVLDRAVDAVRADPSISGADVLRLMKKHSMNVVVVDKVASHAATNS